MRKAGEVTYGDAHGDCGKNRGLVCFVTKSDMERAVDELDGREINGREVRYVTYRMSFKLSHAVILQSCSVFMLPDFRFLAKFELWRKFHKYIRTGAEIEKNPR